MKEKEVGKVKKENEEEQKRKDLLEDKIRRMRKERTGERKIKIILWIQKK